MEIAITGVSRGIGYETVKTFAKEGNHTIYAISRNQQKLNDLFNECIEINPNTKIICIPIDIAVNENINQIFDIITNNTNTLDILINNAGTLVNKGFLAFNVSEIEKMYQVNTIAPMLLIQKLYPLLNKKTITHVINISSMGGFQGSAKFPGLAPYASSKAAIASLTECLAEEFKNTNIKFNCLALGAVNTEMLAEAFPGYLAPTTPEQMSQFIVDFAINGSKMFNGKIIPVSSSTP